MKITNGTPVPALGPMDWRKPTTSIGNSNCAELAAGGQIAIRQNTDPTGPALLMDREELGAFVADVKAAGLDHLLLS